MNMPICRQPLISTNEDNSSTEPAGVIFTFVKIHIFKIKNATDVNVSRAVVNLNQED